MGCPVGIGPEIIVRYATGRGQRSAPGFVVLGDIGVLKRCAELLAVPLEIIPWQPGDAISGNKLHVYNLSALDQDLQWGRPDITTGKAMAVYIEKAVELITEKELAGMVTCPIAKSALHAAGYDYAGHTEMLAALSAAEEFGMMMAGDKLRVTLVTIHVPLAEVSKAITTNAVRKMIELTCRCLRQDFGLEKPRIAVAGLNPHGGEGGAFGTEEMRQIVPALQACQSRDWIVEGPFPPDTVFCKAMAGHYDVVVSMYHDQGLIPFKLVHFEDGVNVTMGLPIVRTSVDHGTAYDIAGKGIAKPTSLEAAINMAARIVGNRNVDQRK